MKGNYLENSFYENSVFLGAEFLNLSVRGVGLVSCSIMELYYLLGEVKLFPESSEAVLRIVPFHFMKGNCFENSFCENSFSFRCCIPELKCSWCGASFVF